MKQLFNFLLFASMYSSANSQITKGNWLVGGNGNLNSFNRKTTSQNVTTEGDYTKIDVSASVGYFFVDKLVVGLKPGYSYFKGTLNTQAETADPTKYYIGPFVRYYLLSTEKQFNILTDASFQVGLNRDVLSPKRNGESNRLSIVAGPEVFFNSSVGLEVLVGYFSTYDNGRHPVIGYTFKQKGFTVSIGFQIHLEKN